MRKCFDVLRTDADTKKTYRQKILYDKLEENDTVATALRRINEESDLLDIDGNPVKEIIWECSCLQKKCGACAMRIDGKPALACSVKLSEKKETIVLEPLKKFPVVADLKVDRRVLYEYLEQMGVWLENRAEDMDSEQDFVYESSRCLQCGCCLEICPNYYAGGDFTGMAAMVPNARVMAGADVDQRDSMKKKYRRRIYEGCGKSLACRDICPAGIDMEHLLTRSNAMMIWKLFNRKKSE